MMRYGFVEEAHRVIKAQLDVAAAFGGRLPELFAGFERGHPASPAAYPTSCSPQAWASAAPLLWLRSLLRIDPWATHEEVRIAPELPPWIKRLRVDRIRIADRLMSVNVDDGNVEIDGAEGLRVIRTPRLPVAPTRSLDDP
jgi:glycogen debranching enzyme